MNKLYCNDGCQKEFTTTQAGIGYETLPGNVERHYMECPNCKEQYTSYFLDDEMKEIQKEIRRLKYKTDLKVKQKNKLLKLSKKLQSMNEKHKREYGEHHARQLH